MTGQKEAETIETYSCQLCRCSEVHNPKAELDRVCTEFGRTKSLELSKRSGKDGRQPWSLTHGRDQIPEGVQRANAGGKSHCIILLFYITMVQKSTLDVGIKIFNKLPMSTTSLDAQTSTNLLCLFRHELLSSLSFLCWESEHRYDVMYICVCV